MTDGRTPAVDVHCHIFPPAYLHLARTEGERPGVTTRL